MLKVLLAILCLAFLVFIHELGHFLAAKAFKVKVTAFALGMGPPIVSKQIGETTYKLCWLPFGGYCAMVGEDGNTDDPRSLLNLVWYKRIVIMLAGIFMNALLSVILVSVLIFPYRNMVVPVVNSITEEASAAYSIYPGDRILSIDSFHIFLPHDIAYAELLNEDDEFTFRIMDTDGLVYTEKAKQSVSLLSNISFGVEDGTLGNKAKQVWNSECSMVQAVIQSLKMLFTGQVQIKEMSGPVGIIDTVSKAETSYNFIYIFAFISINLACMNLLPLPALDGGQALVCLLEGLTKKRAPAKALSAVNAVTLLLLMGLLALVSVSDIIKLFQ